MATDPSLVVMAAGMGSRFGGIKQVAAVGPNGETLLDYSIHDARRAGFRSVVFIIRREIEAVFREQVGRKAERAVEVAYAFQELDDLPAGFQVPTGRTKPWGTGHAVLAARQAIGGPFAVINADDFYGLPAFEALHRFLSRGEVARYALAGYALANTLSPHGSVSRGICHLNARGQLEGIEEATELQAAGDGTITGRDAAGTPRCYKPDQPVSMNCWGFAADAVGLLEREFRRFLEASAADPRAEFYLPAAVDAALQRGEASVEVLPVEGSWFGVTYQEDQAAVRTAIAELIRLGNLPPELRHEKM